MSRKDITDEQIIMACIDFDDGEIECDIVYK
jgi:hypothetical protein